MIDDKLFDYWCETRFADFAGTRREALKYGIENGLLEFDITAIRKIAGLSSRTIRPNKTTAEQRREILAGRKAGKSIRCLAKEFKLTASSIHKIIHKGECL